MLKLFNTLGRKAEVFRPVNKEVVTMFTCGPSVYQRAHIGNFRTFLFEDVLARYLEYSGYEVRRGMNLTDVEDKAITEAERGKITVKQLTEKNIREFLGEIKLLRMKMPDYLPRASECVDRAVVLIKRLLDLRIAYRHKGNIYFDPLKFTGFGKLYGLDMSKWPSKKRRFHKDTYPGMQWNLGDFILWHNCHPGDKYYWDTSIGSGRPSWNIQDPSMISKYFSETLSVYCGGIDNLYRHHDYTLAILESVRPYPMARFWLHCNHLYADGKKMSKSRGNILYVDTLRKLGFGMDEIRFFLIYGHYREKISYSEKQLNIATDKLRSFRALVKKIRSKSTRASVRESNSTLALRKAFTSHMDDDLNVGNAFDALYKEIFSVKIAGLRPGEASGIIKTLKEIDEVLKVIY